MAKGDPAVIDSHCKACSGGWPRPEQFITDLGLSKAYLHDDQFFPGWTVVVFKRHATELFQLTPIERGELMEEVNLMAKTLSHVFKAKKINYELLGNEVPHIHWHVIPRLATDPDPREPVWRVRHEPVHALAAERQDRIRLIGSEAARLR
jgi:diadenosine tetraphosphate (Ap4A) HIT family hydrolase